MTGDAYNVTADELRGFVERIEAQNARIKDETEARKEIFAEAKARVFRQGPSAGDCQAQAQARRDRRGRGGC